jgi:ABC-2 type transport system ATP-binding protein
MIEVKHLTKRYGKHLAIDHLNFTVKKGEVIGFLGPNGAGKSTTMKIITGFMAPSDGVALVGGVDVFENPVEVKKKIGYLPETPPVYLDMYVADYLKYVAELKGVDKSKIKKSVERAMDKTNLTSVSKRLIQNLSKGFRQRVGIAQAIVSDPEILILDEPTVGLDPKQVAEIRDLIKELRGQHTIILSTHILPEVEATCERIIIINKGRIVAEDSLQNLSNRKTGKQSILLRLRKSPADLREKIQSIPGVIQAHTPKITADGTDCVVDTEPSELAIESLAKLVIDQHWGLLGISTQKVDLEDVFLSLTYGENSKNMHTQNVGAAT